METVAKRFYSSEQDVRIERWIRKRERERERERETETQRERQRQALNLACQADICEISPN